MKFLCALVGLSCLLSSLVMGLVAPAAIADGAAVAPTILSPTAGQVVTDPYMNVSWTRPDGSSSFRLYVDEGTSAEQVYTTSVSVAPVHLPASGEHTVRVANVGDDGSLGSSSSTVSFQVVAPPAGPPGISINAGAQYTNSRDVTLRVVWPTGGVAYTDLVIDNDGGFATSEMRALAPTVTWTLVGSGDEKLPKTVYVRFSKQNSSMTEYGAQTFTDDIVLDLTAPTVRTAVATAPAATATTRRVAHTMRKVKVRASDSVSGVGQVQFARSKSKPQAPRPYAGKSFTFRRVPTYVRVIDLAGNLSRWKKILGRG